MLRTDEPGQIVILNGTPRSGKTSLAVAIQNTFDGVWMNLGVDRFKAMTPDRYQPGIGLRPGGERPDLEPLIVTLYTAIYESIAIHSRMGVHVVVDVGHHDSYSVPRKILPKCARILKGLPVLFVGVRCPVEVVMERRRKTWGATGTLDDPVNQPIHRWQHEVHKLGIYDLEVDTSVLSSEECAHLIRQYLENGQQPTAFDRIAAMTEAE